MELENLLFLIFKIQFQLAHDKILMILMLRLRLSQIQLEIMMIHAIINVMYK